MKLLLKRGALLTAANWPTVVIQFVAQTTFQVLLAVPIVGAAILVAVLLGADLAILLQGSLREIFGAIAGALMSEPAALVAFVTAFTIVLVGGSVLMFLVKGGTVEVMLMANAAAGPIEQQPLTFASLHEGAQFTVARFVEGCSRLFRRYLAVGLLLIVIYLVSAAAYMAFVGYIVFGLPLGAAPSFAWALVLAGPAVALVAWITLVNLLYLLLQIATAAEDAGLVAAARAVWRFIRSEFRELGSVFLVVFGMVVAATVASALAWSGVGLVAFVPLVGLAVFPLQLAALLLRGLVFEFIGLTAMGAYVTLYSRHLAAVRSSEQAAAVPTTAALRPAH